MPNRTASRKTMKSNAFLTLRQRHTAFVNYFILLSFSLLSPFVSGNTYELEISKTEQQLIVRNDTQIIKTYRIASGKGGAGTKRRLGDNKTPVGSYKIVDFKQDSKFHYFMQIDYPNLLDAWHGYKDKLISAKDFKQIASAYKNKKIPPQHTALGGYIGIHGIGDVTREKLKIHELHNWTEGCIALKNNEINELRQYVSIGTRVLITE